MTQLPSTFYSLIKFPVDNLILKKKESRQKRAVREKQLWDESFGLSGVGWEEEGDTGLRLL